MGTSFIPRGVEMVGDEGEREPLQGNGLSVWRVVGIDVGGVLGVHLVTIG